MLDEKKYWVWLSEVLANQGGRFRELMKYYSSAREIYEQREAIISKAKLTPTVIKKIMTITLDDCDRQVDNCADDGIGICAYGDDEYPLRLRRSEAATPLLYYTGNISALKESTVAGVGTRKITQYGRESVKAICEPIAKAGVVLVSGLALGTDAEVHRAALSVGTPTVAVLGSAINETVPKRHEQLRFEIEQSGGATVSEYPPGTPCIPYMFVDRDRIIAGLSRAVLVFEAGKKSGALITAGWAVEDGREVFALPGSIFSPSMQGAHSLINQGATLMSDAGIVLERIGMKSEDVNVSVPLQKSAPAPANGDEALIAKILQKGEATLDTLVAETNLSAQKLIATLSIMELEGMIQVLAGQRYKLR